MPEHPGLLLGDSSVLVLWQGTPQAQRSLSPVGEGGVCPLEEQDLG